MICHLLLCVVLTCDVMSRFGYSPSTLTLLSPWLCLTVVVTVLLPAVRTEDECGKQVALEGALNDEHVSYQPDENMFFKIDAALS